MKIYRAADPDPIELADVSIDESTAFTHQLLGEHKADAVWIMSSPMDITLGDYVVVGSEKFYLNRPVGFDKINNFTYRYNAVFEGEIYKLYRKIIMDEGSADFTYFGDPALYLQLIVDNLNSIDSGWTLNIDLPVAYEPKSIAFNEETCRLAINRIMEEFKLEFRLSQKEIIVRQDVGFASTYTFEYGRGKGMYSLRRVSQTDKEVVTRLYGFGGDQNLPASYRDGAKRLIFDNEGNPYVEANVSLYNVREGSVTFPEIYPKRTGGITHVTANNAVRDITLDFNINDHLISGVIAKIVFKSGALSGYEFDILNYDHATNTITFIPKEEANGAVIPDTGSFQPEVDDQYTLVNIDMPVEYVEAAESELLAATLEHHIKLKSPQVVYELEIDEKYVRTYGIELAAGMRVTIIDTALGLEEQIRIFAISFPVVNPDKIVAQIVDTIPYTAQERIIKDVTIVKKEVVEVDRSRIENYREGAVRFRNLQTKIYDPDGYFNGENIRPNSIETLMLSVGAKSQNFLLNLVEIEANYGGDPNKLRISAGSLIHLEVQIEGLGYIWAMDAHIFESLTPATYYYVYARCNSSALTGTWVLSEAPINTESEAGFYHFWMGLLYPVNANNQRFFMFTKGMTYIVGDTITTGKIQSLDGLNFFDVTAGTFNLGNEESGLDWDITNPGALTIRGAVIASAILAEDGYIANLKVKSLKTGITGKRLEILAFADEEETIPVHNLKFYDADGNLAVTLDTAVDSDQAGNPAAGIRVQNADNDRTAMLTANGVFGNSGGMRFIPGSSGIESNASVVGLLFDRNEDPDGISAAVVGIDATTEGDSESYGGYFNSIRTGELHTGTIQITGNYTVAAGITDVFCYNASGTITVTLPANPKNGRTIYVKRINDGGVTVSGNGNNIVANGGPQASRDVNPRGLTLMLKWDGTYWQSNGL